MASYVNPKSMTFWGGLAAIITGIGFIYMGSMERGIQTILGGLIAISGRKALAKVEESAKGDS